MTAPATNEHLLPITRTQLGDAIHTLAGRQRLTVDRDQHDILTDLEHTYRERRRTIIAQHGHDTARVLTDLQRRHEEAITAATTHTTWTDSRYAQLCAALETPKATGRQPHAGSQPPLWVDALDLRHTITTHVTEWAHTWQLGTTHTITALHALADRTWRPQDVAAMTTITQTCLRWSSAIDSLFDPPKRLTLAAPCPACQVATVHRPDSAGEWVRQPALQITDRGCECLNCRHLWDPTMYRHLANVLGCNLPEGVLE
ncbi:DUF7340 domain-containing protein [Gordonia caeni]|uniref:DUF222 domain-containing protein n=1 Tax=Gordonia caeni TaxID=1007097 RepID=A0ABP7PBM3_9ACTN